MGGAGTLTAEARDAIAASDAFIGAARVLESVKDSGKPMYVSYKPVEIAEYLSEHSEYSSVSVLLSGDTSFYSGAKKLRDRLSGYEIITLPGISTLSYMCAKLGIAAEDTDAISLHGIDKSIVCRVRDSRYTFALLGRAADALRICSELGEYGAECRVYIGSRLGYEDERIITTAPESYTGGAADPAAVIIENCSPKCLLGKHPSDGDFIRGKVPMTKESVRALVLAALDPDRESVIYDIGSGTGSVSIALSLISHDITVYAVERGEEALRLTEENRRKFLADNVRVVGGDAPAALEKLPAPDRVFIGGSGGNLREIIEAVLEKNGDAKIVLTAVTLETLSETVRIAERLGLSCETSLISAARSRNAGRSTLILGENPVYIFTLRRMSDDE